MGTKVAVVDSSSQVGIRLTTPLKVAIRITNKDPLKTKKEAG
jgi:hypothetical protein